MSILLSLILSLNLAIAKVDCRWSSIEKTEDLEFIYQKECHHNVGVLVKNEKDLNFQIKTYERILELKDLNIEDLKKDSSMWENEARNQTNKFDKYKESESLRTWIWFGSGVAATVIAVLLTGAVSK